MLDKNGDTFGVGDTVRLKVYGNYTTGIVTDAIKTVHVRTDNAGIVHKYANQVEVVRVKLAYGFDINRLWA